MADLLREEYAVGETIWKQQLRLVRSRHDGRWMWTLKKEAVSQRDEAESIAGLTDDAILAMAEAVRDRRRKPHDGRPGHG